MRSASRKAPNIAIAELFQKRYGMQAGNVIGTGIFKPDYVSPDPGTGQSPNVTPFWLIAGAGAEVEVDTETGHVKITKLVNVVDCGKAINPKAVQTQISGAALMHVGFTMFEKMHHRRRPSDQCVARRLQDSRASTMYRR